MLAWRVLKKKKIIPKSIIYYAINYLYVYNYGSNQKDTAKAKSFLYFIANRVQIR